MIEKKINIIIRIAALSAGIFLLISGFGCSKGAPARADTPIGTSFRMAMTSPDRDTVNFTGKAFGRDMSLTGVLGGIETNTLLTGGNVYTLNPAIKTATKIDNPSPPELDEDGWANWLVEFGRVNPLTFAGMIGLDSDVDGEVSAGDNENVIFRFDKGELRFISFPGGDGLITYTYSDFRDDSRLKASDFEVPEDYLVM